jgi:biotin synthase-like enzyme
MCGGLPFCSIACLLFAKSTVHASCKYCAMYIHWIRYSLNAYKRALSKQIYEVGSSLSRQSSLIWLIIVLYGRLSFNAVLTRTCMCSLF